MDIKPCTTVNITVNVNLNRPKQFIGKSVEHGIPVSTPLKSIEDLFSWEKDDSADKGQLYNVASISHSPKQSRNSVKTLFCHDMKGGYLEDRFSQGTITDKPLGYYNIYWSGIDIFVYFTHNFVTIPPVGWINAAHQNGVTILGTFITEWDDGKKRTSNECSILCKLGFPQWDSNSVHETRNFMIKFGNKYSSWTSILLDHRSHATGNVIWKNCKSRCKAFLSSEALWKATADRLVAISLFYGFDGWLINIENQIEKSRITALQNFLHYLTQEMHKIDQNSLVIWYDSVTADGNVDWQNELNDKNRSFLKATDGIFLNYSWTISQLQSSKEQPVDPSNIYVGVDVFGRGCYGGGGFNTAQALEVIRRFGLSVALFAPGWVYEKFGPDQFKKKNDQFWKLLQELLPCYPITANMGLSSDFCPGFGYLRDPVVVLEKRWFCLDLQGLMPILTSDYLSIHVNESSSFLTISPLSNKQQVLGCESPVQTEMPVVPMLKVCLPSSEECVTITVQPFSDSPLPKFYVMTNVGSCEVDFAFIGNRSIGQFSVEELGVYSRCVKATKSFVVQTMAVVLDSKQHKIQMLCIYPGRFVHKSQQLVPAKVKCSLIDWGKESLHNSLLLSCSLTVEDLPNKTYQSEISYRCLSSGFHTYPPSFNIIGRTLTKRYRVHELLIPNPALEGPSCSVEFLIQHKTFDRNVLGGGRIRLEYAENITETQ